MRRSALYHLSYPISILCGFLIGYVLPAFLLSFFFPESRLVNHQIFNVLFLPLVFLIMYKVNQYVRARY